MISLICKYNQKKETKQANVCYFSIIYQKHPKEAMKAPDVRSPNM